MDYTKLVQYIPAVVVLLGVCAAISYVSKKVRQVKSKIRSFSRAAFGTSSILTGLQQTEQRVQSTPKSVSGGDSMFIAKIKADFPEFNLNNAKTEIIEALKYAYSKSESDFKAKYGDVSLSLDTAPTFGKAHTTVISGYEKSYNDACIKFQCAYEVTNNNVKKQLRAEIDYVFEFNDNKALKCPNCGAPVSKLGVKKCEFCGHGIVYNLSETWQIKRIKN